MESCAKLIKSKHTPLWILSIVSIGVLTPLKNTTPLFLVKPPLKSANCASPTFLGIPPLSILVFHEPSPLKKKLDFSVNPKNIEAFHS